jgi:hypothetical protein
MNSPSTAQLFQCMVVVIRTVEYFSDLVLERVREDL